MTNWPLRLGYSPVGLIKSSVQLQFEFFNHIRFADSVDYRKLYVLKADFLIEVNGLGVIKISWFYVFVKDYLGCRPFAA
jgi:hypothetical protein